MLKVLQQFGQILGSAVNLKRGAFHSNDSSFPLTTAIQKYAALFDVRVIGLMPPFSADIARSASPSAMNSLAKARCSLIVGQQLIICRQCAVSTRAPPFACGETSIR